MLLFAGALFWAKGRDPFQRIWFKVRVPGQSKAECIAVVPKNNPKSEVQSPKSGGGRWTVVVYLHGSGGSLRGDGNELRQMAELGLAVVGMDYCQTNEAAFDAQFIALLNYVRRQPWADTNRMAWVGFSLGAQRSLAFALRHPHLHPSILVRLAGGWVPELDQFEVQGSRFKVQSSASPVPVFPPAPSSQPFEVQGSGFKVQSSGSNFQTASPPSTLNSQPSTSVLLVHGERDEVFPLADAQRVAACLQTNGVPVELRVLPGESHGLDANRLLVFRVIGEQCLTRLRGPDALSNYHSILSWQAQAKPLWLFWTPALLWAALCLWLRRKLVVGQASRLPLEEPLPSQDPRTQERSEAVPLALAACSPATSRPEPAPAPEPVPGNGKDAFHRVPDFTRNEWDAVERVLTWFRGRAAEGRERADSWEEGRAELGSRGRSPSRRAGGTPAPLLWWEIGLRWFAAILAAAALAQTALHLVPPRLATSERTLGIARNHLVAPKAESDFAFLAAKPCWPGKRLKILLEHVELANYNRELINWKLDEQMYQQFVLSPEIDPAADGDLNWRRPLWENFYPRIRKEQSPEAAAEIVVRFLRERVTVAEGNGLPAAVAQIWRGQITNERGFEAVYVAALRSVGIPARLEERKQAELLADGKWRVAPRPLVEKCGVLGEGG